MESMASMVIPVLESRDTTMNVMVVRVVYFSNRGYRIKKIFA